jgi:amidase
VRPYLQEVVTVPQPLRIAFSTQNPFGGLVDPDCIRAVHETAKLCADLGHQVEESAPTLNIGPVSFAFITVFAAGLAAAIDGVKLLTGREPTRDTLESMTWNFYQMGLEVSASQYLLAVATLQRASREFAVFFEKYDVWLTPALGMPPLRVGTFDFTSPAANLADERVLNFVLVNPLYNMTGQPAVSLPAFWNDDGLPIGVLFGARFGDEATLFRLAGQLEQARPWPSRRPPLKD